MKKFVLLLFIFSSTLTFSQLEKGSMLIGGSAGFSGGFSKSYRSYNLQLNPNIGYFVANKFVVGSTLIFGNYRNSNTTNSSPGNSILALGFSPFTRYYFLPMEKKFNIFGQAGLTFGNSWVKNIPTSYSEFFISPNASIGAAYFIRPQIALEARLNVISGNSSFNEFFSNGVNLSSSFGFQIHLNRTAK